MNIKVSVRNEGLTCQTVGLREQFGFEMAATVDSVSLQAECREFILYITNYMASGNTIRPGETIKYGYWFTKTEMDDSGCLVFLEHNPETTDFIFGVNAAISYWRDQHMICEKVGAIFSPPELDQMVVISDGVYEGEDVEAVRYPSPDHMSGWWFTTDRFNGDISTLKTVHVSHISARRPDLVKFLALPFGYRFFSPQSDVWFDLKVANAEI